MNLLDQITDPAQLKGLDRQALQQLSCEIRDLIIETVATNGGHLASNLGVVELTLALLLEFEFPRDQIVFDVGHQIYAWKILTGRRDRFCSLRRYEGLSGFPKKNESCYDFFNTGHSSTSISAALGLSRAMSHSGRTGHVVAVIGDGALTGGMAFEALNDAGQSGEDLLVILNDNQMSIGRNVGGLSRHLEKLRVSTGYMRIRSRLDEILLHLPLIGRPLQRLISRTKQLTRMALQKQGIFFEQLGFRYYGPVDGHDVDGLRQHLRAITDLRGPVLLHVITQKGKGYHYAEESPDLYHGVAPFVVENGLNNGNSGHGDPHSFSEAFGYCLVDLARQNSRICAISAAMTAGTGLGEFAQAFPARFYDVGIAEQHAMTFAAGLAAGGMQPVIALYSTFLQRAYDQLLHDVCLQCLPVVIMVDRAGIVGEDGETHQGIYDLSLLLPLPGLAVYCPIDYANLRQVLVQALASNRPVAIRYPRGRHKPLLSADQAEAANLGIRCLKQGGQVSLIALGTLAGTALDAAGLLAGMGIDAEVLAVIGAKPIDLEALIRSARKTGRVLLMEESVLTGGFGQSVLPGLIRAVPGLRFGQLGLEDQMLCQGSREQLLRQVRLDCTAMVEAARALVEAK